VGKRKKGVGRRGRRGGGVRRWRGRGGAPNLGLLEGETKSA